MTNKPRRTLSPAKSADYDKSRRNLEAHKANSQPDRITRVRKPYQDSFWGKRWVVSVSRSNGLFRSTEDKLFNTKDEAQTYYEQVVAEKRAER